MLLLREQHGRLETFMMRRAATMRFAPGMYVFPGGRLDAIDVEAGAQLPDAYPFAHDARRASADELAMRALVACALRELDEETGVVVEAADLALVDHWVTPEDSAMRYDVRFFAAALPRGQEPEPRGTEMDLVRWIEPLQALAELEVGRMRMLRPTMHVLQMLVEFDRVDEVLAHARSLPIRPKLPRRAVHADGTAVWSIVDDRTGEVLEREVPPPHYMEGSQGQ